MLTIFTMTCRKENSSLVLMRITVWILKCYEGFFYLGKIGSFSLYLYIPPQLLSDYLPKI